MTDVATIDALMAQPWATGIRRETMARIWMDFMADALEYTHAHALEAVIGNEVLPPYSDLFNAALERIVARDKEAEEEGTRAAQEQMRYADRRWAQRVKNDAGFRRVELT